MISEVSTCPHPSPLPGGEGVKSGDTLTLLREWQSVCDAIGRGESQLLIRKGGIAEGRAGFELKKSFFGLLPTLFHQIKNTAPSADTPAPPRVVSLICQLVEAFVLPSHIDLAPLAGLHAYTPEQLAARQTYKPERPLHLILVRPFRLKSPIDLGDAAIKQVCRSWVDVPLREPMGGIESVSEMVKADALVARTRAALERLPFTTRFSQ